MNERERYEHSSSYGLALTEKAAREYEAFARKMEHHFPRMYRDGKRLFTFDDDLKRGYIE